MSDSRATRPAVLGAYTLVLLGPALARLIWISWSDGKASDAIHVCWFATVALVVGVLLTSPFVVLLSVPLLRLGALLADRGRTRTS